MYMYKEQLKYSPSDLVTYFKSSFASWLDHFVVEYPNNELQEDVPDIWLQLLAQQGKVHETDVLTAFMMQGKQVVEVTGKDVAEKLAVTVTAMQEGVDVIAQAYLVKDEFAGYADFLVKIPHRCAEPASRFGDWHYEAWDAKLSSTVKPEYVIQLCAYTEMLQEMQEYLPENITVALGDGTRPKLKVSDYFAYYQLLKADFLEMHRNFTSDNCPDPAKETMWAHWSTEAKKRLVAADHLSLVANISRNQIKQLNKADIFTVAQLAETKISEIPGIGNLDFQRLQRQAVLQKQSTPEIPMYEILPARPKLGLALLPPISAHDVFFNVEGYSAKQDKLDYLWGYSYFLKGRWQFKDLWAHDSQAEKQAFTTFIKWVHARWQNDSQMHIYHYGVSELTACQRLMGKYAVCEREVDDLLRNEVFVDLRAIFKDSIILGEPDYSLSNVERLYRQTLPLTADNVSVKGLYGKWCTLREHGLTGETWQSAEILQVIREQIVDSCSSLQELVAWLREQQELAHIDYAGKSEIIVGEITPHVTEVTQLSNRLLEKSLGKDSACGRQAQLEQTLAWLLEFHRRESKPTFWRLFDRQDSDDIKLFADGGCLAGLKRTNTAPFYPSSRSRRLAYEYEFDTSQPFKAAQHNFYVKDLQDGERDVKVELDFINSNLKKGIIVLKSAAILPDCITIIPDEYVNPRIIANSLYDVVESYDTGNLPEKSAIIDFLQRNNPRIKGHVAGNIASAKNTDERLAQIIHSVQNLDNSYLTIQGPPGAGKSFTASRIIAQLLKDGKKIAISSNSHAAINNLLFATAEVCQKEKIPANFACARATNEKKIAELNIEVLSNVDILSFAEPASVVGTTAWGFSRSELAGKFDYLFIDEAGQVAVANLVAMSRCANNLVLLGDQMQLGQPLQGVHPGESGLSVLDYLLPNTPTIPEDMGIFLDITWRMHPKINHFISKYFYDGKLVAHPNNKMRTIEVPTDYDGILQADSGVIFVPVAHEGNAQMAMEEAMVIKELATSLLGRTFHTGKENMPTRKITWEDMLFVAPYNQQVKELKMILGAQARVGSVDKFQGQEAPIVFLSMCVSDGSELAQTDFLFDKHRMNVAISRAQSLAIVVASPNIRKVSVSNLNQLNQVNTFDALIADER